MPKKVKLSLSELSVTSFSTSCLKAGEDGKAIDAYSLNKQCFTYGCNKTHPQLCTGNLIKVCPVL